MAGLKLKSSFLDGRFIVVGWNVLCGKGHIINLGLTGSKEVMPGPKGG